MNNYIDFIMGSYRNNRQSYYPCFMISIWIFWPGILRFLKSSAECISQSMGQIQEKPENKLLEVDG
jgi:hypothetical protein